MSPVLFALFYVLGLASAVVAGVALPELVVRVNWWLRGYDQGWNR